MIKAVFCRTVLNAKLIKLKPSISSKMLFVFSLVRSLSQGFLDYISRTDDESWTPDHSYYCSLIGRLVDSILLFSTFPKCWSLLAVAMSPTIRNDVARILKSFFNEKLFISTF